VLLFIFALLVEAVRREDLACPFDYLIVMICFERKNYWLVVAGGRFVMREKYYWLISQTNRAMVITAEEKKRHMNKKRKKRYSNLSP
jgi:hypothetical protein